MRATGGDDSTADAAARVGAERFDVVPRGNAALARAPAGPRLQRAIGAVYRPETERQGHYVHVRPARRFDALVRLDETRAVEPPDRPAASRRDEPPEPFAGRLQPCLLACFWLAAGPLEIRRADP